MSSAEIGIFGLNAIIRVTSVVILVTTKGSASYGLSENNYRSFVLIQPSSLGENETSNRLGSATKLLYSAEKSNISTFAFLARGSFGSLILKAKTRRAIRALKPWLASLSNT
jgi:hypothetical protein